MNEDIWNRISAIAEELQATGDYTDMLIAAVLVTLLGAIQRGLVPMFAAKAAQVGTEYLKRDKAGEN